MYPCTHSLVCSYLSVEKFLCTLEADLHRDPQHVGVQPINDAKCLGINEKSISSLLPHKAQETSRKRWQGICRNQNLLLNRCVPDMTDRAVGLSWAMFRHKTPQMKSVNTPICRGKGLTRSHSKLRRHWLWRRKSQFSSVVGHLIGCPCFSGSPTLRCVMAALIELSGLLNGPLQKIRRGAEVGRGNV